VDWEVESGGEPYPYFVLRIPSVTPRLTIATYGYNFELARAAALELAYEHEIFAEIVLFSQLSPFELDPLFDSVRRTGRLLTIEEGTYTLGWGAEVAARVAETLPGTKIRRVAALDLPIANSKTLEDASLPSQAGILKVVFDLLK
jgi:pyruvate/2-oxoglutarate/acetoin dehydrogenase E1 component